MTIVRAQSKPQISKVNIAQQSVASSVRQPCTHRFGGRTQPVGRAQDIPHGNCNGSASSAVEGYERDRVARPTQVINQAPIEDTLPSSSLRLATSIFLLPLLVGGPALAYSPVDGEQLFKNVAGGLYLLLVCIFFFRLFRKRAVTGTSQSFRTQVDEEHQQVAKKRALVQERDVTPLGAAWGAVQAGIICFLLFQLCGLVDGYFDRQEMPTQFTARNITITLRTVIRGLTYLMTFLFGANCVGLSGLAVQMLLFPDSLKPEEPEQEKPS